MALSSLLRAAWRLLGYLLHRSWAGLLEELEGWRVLTPIRAIAAAEGCPSAIAVALWWLLRAGVARVGLVGVPFPCGAGRTFGGFGGFGSV